MLPVNKNNCKIKIIIILILQLFFILSDDCYSEMVANMHAPMTRMAVIIITT